MCDLLLQQLTPGGSVPHFLLSELDPCWRAVRVLADEKTNAPAQLLGSFVIAAYPGVLDGSMHNPFLELSIATNAIQRLLLLAETGNTHSNQFVVGDGLHRQHWLKVGVSTANMLRS